MQLVKTLMLLPLLSFSLEAKVKVIYGEDNRKDPYQVANAEFVELAKSTAAQIPTSNLAQDADRADFFRVKGRTMKSRGYCSTERFYNQEMGGRCSTFLVGPNLLATAGHCIKNETECKSYSYVFDYKVESDDQNAVSVKKSNVYTCKRLIKSVLTRSDKNDYALIELDRVVTERTPLKFRTEGQVAEGDQLVVIGHPMGLPTKIADGAYVRRNVSDVYFQSNLDTYGGNSGSAVFNISTGEIEGILVRGETDFKYNRSRRCSESNVCTDKGCRGEDVTRITQMSQLILDNMTP